MAKVKVYSTPTCPACKQTKEFLHENKIEFQEINVADDQKALQEMVEKSGHMAVPVIDIDGEIILGFDKSKLQKALKIS